MLPFPSDFFLQPDSETGSGQRVSFGTSTLPTNLEGVPIRPDHWNRRDGYPTLGSLHALFPGVSLDGLVSHVDLAAFAQDDVRTLILDTQTSPWNIFDKEVRTQIPPEELNPDHDPALREAAASRENPTLETD